MHYVCRPNEVISIHNLYFHGSNYLKPRCTNPWRQLAVCRHYFWTLPPNICETFVRNLFHVTILPPIICRRLQQIFGKSAQPWLSPSCCNNRISRYAQNVWRRICYDQNCNWCGENAERTLSGKSRYVPENSISALSRAGPPGNWNNSFKKPRTLSRFNTPRWTYVSPPNYAENFFSHYTQTEFRWVK